MSTRKNADLRGILAAVPTPFTADGSAIDEDALRRQVERYVAAGLDGIVPTGTTKLLPGDRAITFSLPDAVSQVVNFFKGGE